MSISGGFITAYIVVGVISTSLIFDNPPSWVTKIKWREILIQILFIIFWLPYLIANGITGLFTKVDIWFRKIDD